MTLHVSRRTLLRGLGAAVALPWLEAMGPVASWGAAAPARKASAPAPNRMAFLYVPNGKNMADWTPKKEGADFDLPPILEPLKDLKLTAVRGAKILGSAVPGETIRLAAEITGRLGELVQARATAAVGSRTVLQVELTLGASPPA